MKLAELLATVTAAAALASMIVGPVAAVMKQFADRSHPAVVRFESTAARYRQVMTWGD